jgi:hypothetical protein
MSSCGHKNLIDDYLLNRLGEDEKARFEDHFFNCSACFEELKAREEILSVIKHRSGEIFAGGLETGVAAPRAAWKWRPWLAAAGLIAVAGLSLILFLPHRPESEPVFTLGQEDVMRGEVLELISPGDITGPFPVFFEWKPLSRKARYILFLYDQELIWSEETDDSRLAVPEEITKLFQPGRTYSWEVKAYSPPGTMITASTRARFRTAGD